MVVGWVRQRTHCAILPPLHPMHPQIWNTANELKEHQQHIRVFECAEREGRRAILTAQSAEQRTLAADFLAFFVTSLNQQEEVHRQFLMGEEQLGWDIVRNVCRGCPPVNIVLGPVVFGRGKTAARNCPKMDQ